MCNEGRERTFPEVAKYGVEVLREALSGEAVKFNVNLEGLNDTISHDMTRIYITYYRILSQQALCNHFKQDPFEMSIRVQHEALTKAPGSHS